MVCLFTIWKRTAGMAVAAALIAAAVLLATFNPPLRDRASQIFGDLRAGNYDAAITYRATAVLSAWRMGRDHPLVGVGPGCFGWQYYDYKLAVERDHPQLLQSLTRHLNFAEAHNDVLQTFAVSGIPGALVFIASLAMLGAGSFAARQGGDADPRKRFAELMSLPLAISFFILALAFFPLSLAATISTCAFIGGVCARWSRLP